MAVIRGERVAGHAPCIGNDRSTLHGRRPCAPLPHADSSAASKKTHRRENVMPLVNRGLCAASAAVMALALSCVGVRAEQKPYVMKITTPTINDTVHQLCKNFGAAVEKMSNGRIKAEVYPASQLGPIPRQIEGTQFGAIQVAVIPPEFFVGVDERFELMASPGLINDMRHGQRLAADPQVLKLMLSLGANKGLHGAGLFLATPSHILSKTPIRHIDDFKGKKLRIFASDFQFQAMKRLGVTPVAMTLGDVLPAIQQGTIDGAIAALNVYVPMHFNDAAKYVTEINTPAIFLIVEVSKKWYESLPKDLQEIIDKAAKQETIAINKDAEAFVEKMRKVWVDRGGELIKLPPDEQASLMKTLINVGADVSKNKPKLAAAYKIVSDAANRLK
jgi:TRAP-type C4-dicarboxylate transport system substrate-binding protein